MRLPWIFLFIGIQSTFCKFSVAQSTEYSEWDAIPNEVPYRRLLDPSTGLTLEWRVDRERRTITLSITSLSRGYVIIGLTRNRGVVEGADFVVLGQGDDGNNYVYDMYGRSNRTLAYDVSQDWRLADGEFPRNREFLGISVERNLETCDEDDILLNADLTHVIWDYGNLPSLSDSPPSILPFERRGILPIYLLDPELPLINPRSANGRAVQTWRMSRRFRIPPRHTSYWCSIERAPRLRRTHYIIGSLPYFKNALSRKHVHHHNVFMCTPPRGVDARTFFEPFVNHPGLECYIDTEGSSSQFPLQHCRSIVHLWAVGGYAQQFPDDVGFAFGGPDSYFMLQSHYNNPEERSDLVVEDGIDFHYTSERKPNSGGMLLVGYGSITNVVAANVFAVPPETTDFTIGGQCSPHCTKDVIPESGVELFGVFLHGHLSSRKMRVRHFRGDRELPWIQHDNNYDFNFQQLRLLNEPVTILPGDHLVNECDYDTTWTNGSATVSGLSTRDEMCNAFLYLRRRLPFMQCNSEYPSKRVLDIFGVRNFTWDRVIFERVITSADRPFLIGQPFSQVVTEFTDWNPSEVRNFEDLLRYSTHEANCPNILDEQAPTSDGTIVTFPSSALPYQPSSTCRNPGSRLQIRSEGNDLDRSNRKISVRNRLSSGKVWGSRS